MMIHRELKTRYFKRALRARGKTRQKRLPRVLYPERVEARYLSALKEILRFIHGKIDAEIKPMLPALAQHYGRVRKDDEDLGDLADALEKIRIEVTQEYTPDELKRLARITGTDVAEWNAKQMNGQLSGIVEVDIFGSEPWLASELGAFVVQNVDLIESIGSQYLDQVTQTIGTAIRAGTRVEEIASDLEDRYGVSESRARLIARDQIGKFNGQLTEIRQKDLGIESYIWRGVGDARERDSHVLLNNTPQRWDDPPDVGHPGEDYQCRCWAEPDLSGLYSDSEST